MRLLIALILCFFLTSFTFIDSSLKGSISIDVEGIKEVKGEIGILVFNQAKGFPSDEKKAILKKVVQVNSKRMNIELDPLPYGKYAISIVHDVNANEKLDKNIFGVPAEPFGFSNVDKVYFGPPKFEEAQTMLSAQKQNIIIRLIEAF